MDYEKVGNMTTNGKGEKLVYDGFGRLREVRLTGESDRIKSAYRYNGLGMRISQAINLSSGSSDDDVTDAGDSVTFFANDERWRIAAAYSSSGSGGTGSASLLERYVHHAAGQAGKGGSSYIDAVVLRDRDLDTEESSTADGGTNPLEERTYILQNWRADVVATARRNGSVIEKMQYTAYGAAVTHLYQGTVRGDFDSNGGVDGSDLEAFELAWENGEPSTDVNFDGGITSADLSAFLVIWATGELSTDIYESHAGACQTTAVRFGYAGYVRDGSVNGDRVYTDAAAGLYHVRHRVYDPELGRWTRRDPVGYVDGGDLYEYARSKCVIGLDPSGLVCLMCCGPAPCCSECREAADDAAPMTDEECCRRLPPVQGNPAGIVVCCQGRKVACSLRRDSDCSSPVSERRGCGVANSLISACIRVHERGHFDDVEQCDPDRIDPYAPRWRDGLRGDPAAQRRKECESYKEELACLDTALSKCDELIHYGPGRGTDPKHLPGYPDYERCRKDIQTTRKFIEGKKDYYCNTKNGQSRGGASEN